MVAMVAVWCLMLATVQYVDCRLLAVGSKSQSVDNVNVLCGVTLPQGANSINDQLQASNI